MATAERKGGIDTGLRRLLVLRLLALMVLITGIAGGAAADGVDPLDLGSLGAPWFESFTARDGLPDGVITAIGVDAEGFAWASSPRGLYRFAGHRWQRRFGPEAGTVHRRMWLDHQGSFWVPSHDSGVALQRNGRWELLDRSDGLPTDHIYRISQTRDVDGRIRTWLLTVEGGLFERVGDRWIPDPGNDVLPSSMLLSMATTTDIFGEWRQWIGTGNDGLWFRRQGESRWTRFILDGAAAGQIEDLQRTVDSEGESLWISSFGRGLYRLHAGGNQKWSVENGGLRANEIYTISIDEAPDGRTTAWVASRDGLVRVRGDDAEIFDRRHGLPSDQVRSARLWRSPDGVGVLWIATEAGVARAVFTDDRWRTASLMGSGALGVFGVLVETEGRGGERLWVASSRDGLGLYENGQWRRFSSDTGHLPNDGLRMIERAIDLDGDNTLWVGVEDGHLVRVREGPRFEVVPTPWPKYPAQEVMDVLSRDEEGRRELWFATRRSAVYRWTSEGWTETSAVVEGETWTATSLLKQIDHEGRSWLWAGSSHGLARFDGSRWELVEALGLPRRNLIGLSLEPGGRDRQTLWIGTSLDGVLRVDVTDPNSPVVLPAEELPPPIDVTVYSASHDSRGHVYLCTNDGVQQLTRTETGEWRDRVFRRRDGMVHEECNTNAQFIDRHDRFWTGTLGGLTVFDPGVPEVGVRRRLRLVGLNVDHREVEPDNLRLEPATRELQAEFTLQSWQREEETRYRTQLVGFDPEPGLWTSQPTRTLTNIPPGDYRLRIEARDFAGVEAHPLDLEFVVIPAWWERRDIQGGFVAGSVMILFGAARWRTRNLRAQKERLEAEVVARTEQLHAANLRLRRLSYTDALTELANRRMLLERLETMAVGQNGDAPLCSLIFIDVDHFKDYNDRRGHPAGDEALRTIASSLLSCAPSSALVARYGGEEFACLLPGRASEEAFSLAEKMRRDIEDRSIAVPGSADRENATISAGIATVVLHDDAAVHRLLRDADRALYRAKNDGRNCVRS